MPIAQFDRGDNGQTGFIQLPRYIVAQFKKPFTRSEALIWLFAEASYRDRNYCVGTKYKPIALKRGQLAHSTRYMAKAWGWPETNVRRFLDALKLSQFIHTETGAGISVITLTDYGVSEIGQNKSGAETAHERRRKEERNKEIKEKEDSCAKAPKEESEKEFQNFKTAYPKRIGGQGWPTAQKHFNQAIKTGEATAADLVAAARKFAASISADTAGTQFVPMAETWMRKGNWREYLPTQADIESEKQSIEFMRSKGWVPNVITGGWKKANEG